MSRKIILTLLTMLILTTNGIAKDKPVTPKLANKNLEQQLDKIKKVKQTKEGKETFTIVEWCAKKYNLDPKLVHAVILTESGYNHRAKSSAGAIGLMQVKPYKQRLEQAKCNNLYDKKCNVEVGVRYLSGLIAMHGGNLDRALASYNAGGYAVKRSIKQTGQIPKCTRGYVKKVKEYRTLYYYLD